MSTESIKLEAKLIERMISKRNEIISNAQRDAGKVVDEAEEESQRIIAEAKEEAHKILASELKAARDRIIGGAELEGRRILADSRESVVSDVFKEVERRMVNVVNGRDKNVNYGDILRRLIEEAASNIGEKKLIVAANDRDRRYLLKNLSKIKKAISKNLGYVVELRIEKKPLDCLGGTIVYDSSRKRVYHNTLEGRLLKYRRLLEAEVAQILVGS